MQPTNPGLLHARKAQIVTTAPPRTWHSLSPERRQDFNSPPICGFIDGSPTNTVTCEVGYYCAAISTFVGCCQSIGTCSAVSTTCYDSVGPSCNDSCRLNSKNLICPATLPYCIQYNYAGGATGYGCGPTSRETFEVLTTTTTSSTSLSSFTSNTATSSSSGLSSPTPSPSGSLSGGAIAGIVVGIIAAVAILAAIVFCLTRKKRIRKQRVPPQPQAIDRQELQAKPYRLSQTTTPPVSPAVFSDRGSPSELDGTSASSPIYTTHPERPRSTERSEGVPKGDVIHELPASMS